jgi:hypothetical protein
MRVLACMRMHAAIPRFCAQPSAAQSMMQTSCQLVHADSPLLRTRLHSVPSAFQLVTLADTFRNMGKAWRPTTSAASRKLLQRPICRMQQHKEDQAKMR